MTTRVYVQVVSRKRDFNKDVGGFVEVVEKNWFIRTTKQIVDKDVKLTWRDLWEVDVGQVLREEIIEQDVDRALYGSFHSIVHALFLYAPSTRMNSSLRRAVS